MCIFKYKRSSIVQYKYMYNSICNMTKTSFHSGQIVISPNLSFGQINQDYIGWHCLIGPKKF